MFLAIAVLLRGLFLHIQTNTKSSAVVNRKLQKYFYTTQSIV